MSRFFVGGISTKFFGMYDGNTMSERWRKQPPGFDPRSPKYDSMICQAPSLVGGHPAERQHADLQKCQNKTVVVAGAYSMVELLRPEAVAVRIGTRAKIRRIPHAAGTKVVQRHEDVVTAAVPLPIPESDKEPKAAAGPGVAWALAIWGQ